MTRLIGHSYNPRKLSTSVTLAFFILMVFFVLACLSDNLATSNRSIGLNWISVGPSDLDLSSILAPPGHPIGDNSVEHHVLGTDHVGRDVMAVLIHGAKTAFAVALPAAGLAFLLGVMYGVLVGYYTQRSLSYSAIAMVLRCIWLIALLITLYVFYPWFFIKGSRGIGCIIWPILFVFVFYLGMMFIQFLNKIRWLSKWRIRVGDIGMRVIDFLQALPILFIVLVVLQLLTAPSIWSLIGLISFLLWPIFVRHARAETLRLKSSESVMSAIECGRSDWWIIRYEIFPQAIRPAWITLAFSMGTAIMLEATLSFLGLGLPIDHTSWGMLIAQARTYPQAWWLFVPSGVCLLLVIWSFHQLGRYAQGGIKNIHGRHIHR